MITGEQWSARKSRVEVAGRHMAYVEMGEGRPIVLQHGNPTSSYLWRNILPRLADLGRCIAIDLIGMGDSDKLPGSGPGRYDFFTHQRFLEGVLAALGVERDAVLILHDWGSALGLDWARRHPEKVAGICHMEGIIAPLNWSDLPDPVPVNFRTLRSEAGEKLILEDNIFIEQFLPGAMLTKLSETEMDAYRAPFLNAGEDRRPMLDWPRQIPFDGEPAGVCETIRAYGAWMIECAIPKLLIDADPGAVAIGRLREIARSWPNQTEVTVRGLHFVQEDSPEEIVRAIRDWMAAAVAGVTLSSGEVMAPLCKIQS